MISRFARRSRRAVGQGALRRRAHPAPPIGRTRPMALACCRESVQRQHHLLRATASPSSRTIASGVRTVCRFSGLPDSLRVVDRGAGLTTAFRLRSTLTDPSSLDRQLAGAWAWRPEIDLLQATRDVVQRGRSRRDATIETKGESGLRSRSRAAHANGIVQIVYQEKRGDWGKSANALANRKIAMCTR